MASLTLRLPNRLFCLSVKPSWCWFCHLNEGGLRALQIGFVVLEIAHNNDF